MRQLKQLLRLIALTTLAVVGATHAQELWKYTDKDGKVTYSDKAPKKGETAQLVPNDSSANVIEAPKNTRQGVPQKLEDVKARAAARESKRDNLSAALDAAKAELAQAKAALETGREPLPEELQITVGRSATGAPTGANSQMRKPEYYTRIAALEEAVKKAESKVEDAERTLRRDAP